MEGPRIVISGIGLVSPLGLDTPSTWQGLLEGRSGIGPITRFDPSRVTATLAAEVRGFDVAEVVGRKDARKSDLAAAYALAAGREAWTAARGVVDDPARVGVVVGSALGGFNLVESQARLLAERGPERLSPHFLAHMLVDTPTSYLASDLGLRGPNFAVVSACATGAHAIGVAAEMVRRGEADMILAGATEAPITELVLGGFCAMRALGTPREGDRAESVSRPFDVSRNGFTIGEGAAIVVVETEAGARARGVDPIAEVVAYGASNDAYHIVQPHPDGIGVVEMMRAALARAGMEPEAVGYVNAHGTSTPLNDRSETRAIRTVFGGHADRLPVSSTKSMTGHLIAAAGALETAICALALRDRVVPPTTNYRDPDPECDLDYVTEGARRLPDLDVAISNSMGLGGHNGCTLLRRIP